MEQKTKGDSLDYAQRGTTHTFNAEFSDLHSRLTSTRVKWRTYENLLSFVEFCKTAHLLECQDTLVAIMFYLRLEIEESLLIT